MKFVYLPLLAAAGLFAGQAEEAYSVTINPAFKYYQAYLLAPTPSDADRDYLFTNNWRGQKLPARFGELVTAYNSEFRLVRQAAHAKVPCDWGIDWTPGPGAILPQLARIKGIAQTAKLKAMWYLQNGEETEACDDLLAAMAAGRFASDDHTLISVLVQIAVENIICGAIAENFYQFSPESLKRLAAGMDALPPRGDVAVAVPMERVFFHEWLLKRVQALQQENPGNEAKVIAGIRSLLADMGGGEGDQGNYAERAIQAGGGTSSGLVKLLQDEEQVYERIARVMALALPQYEAEIASLTKGLPNPQSPFAPDAIPAIKKARAKEFTVQATLAMVRAAIEYKLHGEEGLRSVADPCGDGPFAFSRFVLEGVDRGFELKSAYSGRGFPEVLIFVEQDGPVFNVAGPHAGAATPK